MNKKFYLDTCIWRDYFENRSDNFRPLGEWAFDFIKKVITEGYLILYSDLTIKELRENYSEKEIQEIFRIASSEHCLKKVIINDSQKKEARILCPLSPASNPIFNPDFLQINQPVLADFLADLGQRVAHYTRANRRVNTFVLILKPGLKPLC